MILQVLVITKNPKKVIIYIARKVEFNGKKLKISYGYSEKPDYIDAENISKFEVVSE